MTRGKASCGLSWVSCGLLDGPRPAVGLQRSPARGARGWPQRRFPTISDNKTGQVVSETLGRLLTQNF